MITRAPQALAQLGSHRADAGRSGLNQYGVAGLHLTAGLKKVVRGQENDGHSSGLDRVGGFRVGEDQISINSNVLRLALGSHCHDTLADGEMGNVAAQLLDNAGGFQAQGGGQVGGRGNRPGGA